MSLTCKRTDRQTKEDNIVSTTGLNEKQSKFVIVRLDLTGSTSRAFSRLRQPTKIYFFFSSDLKFIVYI